MLTMQCYFVLKYCELAHIFLVPLACYDTLPQNNWKRSEWEGPHKAGWRGSSYIKLISFLPQTWLTIFILLLRFN